MAFSPLKSKALHHNRSLSFPSKENPSTSHLDENLSSLKTSKASCSSLLSMKNRVKGLKNLYTNIDDLLQLPHIHNIIISQEQSVDQVLEGYIRILDACTAAKDLASNTRHDVQELLSALRQKDASGITSYLNSRKLSKKNIQKSLKKLKNSSSQHIECEESDLVHKLKDAESVTISMLESLLSYFVGTKMQARQSGWSLVTKMMLISKKGEDSTRSNEFKKIDACLETSVEGLIQAEEMMNLLRETESSIQDVEEELECLFRQMIRTRVFLLNILNK